MFLKVLLILTRSLALAVEHILPIVSKWTSCHLEYDSSITPAIRFARKSFRLYSSCHPLGFAKELLVYNQILQS